MSRIGVKPVVLPAGVEAKIDGNCVVVKGPKGELKGQFDKNIKIEIEENEIRVSRGSDHKDERAKHGLVRSLVSNMVTGVSEGFEKKMELVGVGYKAEKKGNKLVLSLGYSHPVEIVDPEGITTEVPTANQIVVKGIDKQLVGDHAANIRAWRKPEPYKGKGVKYEGEHIRRKEGKAGVKSE